MNPTPAEIRAARQAAGLTQAAAATLIHAARRAWQEWEGGRRRMPPAKWELFRQKTAPN
jgi:DNA (cytosine-5)-methyltransferase 1